MYKRSIYNARSLWQKEPYFVESKRRKRTRIQTALIREINHQRPVANDLSLKACSALSWSNTCRREFYDYCRSCRLFGAPQKGNNWNKPYLIGNDGQMRHIWPLLEMDDWIIWDGGKTWSVWKVIRVFPDYQYNVTRLAKSETSNMTYSLRECIRDFVDVWIEFMALRAYR